MKPEASLFRDVGPEQVSGKRKVNRQITRNDEQVLRGYLAGDFWKFAYVSKAILKDNYVGVLHEKYSYFLDKYIDEDFYRLRSIVNAVRRKHDGEAYSYDLSSLSSEDMEAAEFYYIVANVYGYYLWDVYSLCSSSDLIVFYIHRSAVPLPPMPFPSNNEQKARAITLEAVCGVDFCLSDEFIKEISSKEIDYVISARPGDCDFENKVREVKMCHEGNSMQSDMVVNGDFCEYERIENFLKIRKIVVPDSFSNSSNAARCVGLLMYDEMLKVGCSVDCFIEYFKKSEMYRDLSEFRIFPCSSNPYLSDKDNLTLKRWLKTTELCIQEKSVFAFK